MFIGPYVRYSVLVAASTAVGLGIPVEKTLYSQEGSKCDNDLHFLIMRLSLCVINRSTEPTSECKQHSKVTHQCQCRVGWDKVGGPERVAGGL